MIIYKNLDLVNITCNFAVLEMGSIPLKGLNKN